MSGPADETTTTGDARSPEQRATRRAARRRWWVRALGATVVFLVLAELGVRAASSTLGDPLVWYSRTAQAKAEVLAAKEQRRDVVFAGSSVVAASLDPAIFMRDDTCGRTAYNAATAGSVPEITADWLDRVVLPSVRPSVVVLGITPRDLSKAASNATTPYFGAAAVRDDLGARVDRWFSSWSYLVRYRNTIRNPVTLKGRLDVLRVGEDPTDYDANGFRRIDDAAAAPDTDAQSQIGLTLDAEQVRALDRLVVHLRNRKVEPVIAALGSSEAYASTPTARRLVDAANAAVDDIAARHDLTLVDLRDVSDPANFVDLVHTNSAGATIESERLTAAMATVGPGCTR